MAARTDGFSALDRMIIDAAVATSQGAEGALAPAALRELVEETVAMNAKRPRSCFHRGFLAALMKGEALREEPDDDRAAWQLCGYLCGAERQGGIGALADVLAARPATVKHLGAGNCEASGIAAPILFEATLIANGLPAAAHRLAPAAVLAGGADLASRILDEAIKKLRMGVVEEAAPAIELLDRAFKSDATGVVDPNIRREHRRRIGQLHRVRGDFERAAAIFDEILAGESPEWMRRRTLSDLGLCRGRFRALSDVRLPAERSRFAAVAEALGAGEQHFRDAAASAVRTGGHGEFCLGVLLIARGKPAEAQPLLARAIAQMTAEPDVYAVGGVLQRARLYLLSAGGLDRAEADLAAAIEAIPGEVIPLLGEVLLELAIHDAGRAASIADQAHRKLGDAVVDVAQQVGLLDKLPPLRTALLARAATEGRPAAERFEVARQVLVAARDANDLEQAREAFDVLEDLASRTAAERAKFLGLAGDLDAWESVWDPHEARFAMVPLLIQEGRSADAATLLIAGARDLVARGDEGSLEMARESLEQAHLWGEDIPQDLKRAVGPPPPLSTPARKPHGRVLLIGGNETQKQYAAFLQEHVRTTWPGVTLDIEFPGWSSNWGRELPRFESKVQTAGAVVLLKFVRTLFGHRMRAFCSRYSRPWVPCTGHGRDSIQRAVDRAVLLLC